MMILLWTMVMFEPQGRLEHGGGGETGGCLQVSSLL